MSEHRCYGCMQLHDGDFCPHCGWPAGKNNEVHQLSVGTLLHGQYEIGRVLGQGGFGITYLGWDRQLGAAVCIKEYFPSHAVSRDCTVSNLVRCHTEAGAESFRLSKERFLREGRVLARFRDIPEIVSVYGSFEENDTVYIVMEYIKGMDLAHYVNHRGGRLSGEETFKILKPVMEALAQVHRSELVHRDIAPDNIMLHPRGGAKLLDFGAARMVENADVDKGLDRSTEAIVKHGFAPMEQYQTRGNLGPWTDVYAMCATVYYCLTGQIPPEATTRLMGESSFSWANVPGLTDRQRTALERGMAVLPKDRYRSMEELLDGLFGNAPMPMTYTEPVHTAPQPPVYAPQAPAYIPQAPAPRKRSKLVPILAGVLAAVALLVGGTLLAVWARGALSARPAPEAYAPAATEAPRAEAPMAEAPRAEAVPEHHAVGIISCTDSEAFPELLMDRLSNAFPDVTQFCALTIPEEGMVSMVEQFIAEGCDVIVIEDMDLTGDTAKMIADITASCGVQLLLTGPDPADSEEGAALMREFGNICYVGMGPMELAELLITLQCDPIPDKNMDAAFSYVCITREDAGQVDADVCAAMGEIMNRVGMESDPLGYASVDDCAVLLEDVFAVYGERVEVIFCGDAAAAKEAIMACEALGIDYMGDDVYIIAMGATDDVLPMYLAGRVKAFMNYSDELLADSIVTLLRDTVFQGSQIGGWYAPEGLELYE